MIMPVLPVASNMLHSTALGRPGALKNKKAGSFCIRDKPITLLQFHHLTSTSVHYVATLNTTHESVTILPIKIAR